MFCTKCGKEISEDAKFCIYCGASVIGENVKTENIEKQTPVTTTTNTIKNTTPTSAKSVVNKNQTAGIIKGIGIVTIVFGLLASLILSIGLDDDFPIILICGSITSLVSGISFIGFAEIISLLQENTNKQNEVIEILKKNGNEEKE